MQKHPKCFIPYDMETKSREVLLKEAFDQVRIIVSADCHVVGMKDNNHNYVQLAMGSVQHPAWLKQSGENLPKVGGGTDMHKRVAQDFVRFLSTQTTMFIFDGETQDFRKIDLKGVSISDPKFAGKEGSASVYTVKPGLF